MLKFKVIFIKAKWHVNEANICLYVSKRIKNLKYGGKITPASYKKKTLNILSSLDEGFQSGLNGINDMLGLGLYNEH